MVAVAEEVTVVEAVVVPVVSVQTFLDGEILHKQQSQL